MFHRLNGVASRGTRGPAAAPALAKTDVPRRARVAAIVVSVASTWLTLSSVRLLFDPGLEVLPADGDLFAHLYGRARQPGAGSGAEGSVSWQLTGRALSESHARRAHCSGAARVHRDIWGREPARSRCSRC